MKSNEDYLDELLKSMNQETTESSPLARFGLQTEIEEDVPAASVPDAGMGKMDQAMIDALLAGAVADTGSDDVETIENLAETTVERIEIGDSLDDLEPEFRDQFIVSEDIGYDLGTEITEISTEEQNADILGMPIEEQNADILGMPIEEQISDMLEMPIEEELSDMFAEVEESEVSESTETSSMLAQLMAEMQEEAKQSEIDSFEDVELMDEESIDALLNAAKDSSGSMYEEQPISFDMSDDGDMAEIEAMLSMSESDEAMEENSALLRMLEEAEAATPDFMKVEEEALEVDEAELDAILSGSISSDISKKEEINEDNKQIL